MVKNHNTLKPKVTSINCLFCLTNSPKPKYTQFAIT